MTTFELERAANAAAREILQLEHQAGSTAKDQDGYELAFASARRSRMLDRVVGVIKEAFSVHVLALTESTPSPAVESVRHSEVSDLPDADARGRAVEALADWLCRPCSAWNESIRKKCRFCNRQREICEARRGHGWITGTADVDALYAGEVPRCSDCKIPVGGQHRPSCHRQGLVTPDSDYRASGLQQTRYWRELRHAFDTVGRSGALADRPCLKCGMSNQFPMHYTPSGVVLEPVNVEPAVSDEAAKSE